MPSSFADGHWPSTISHDFGTLDSPTIHFRWVHLFGAISSPLLQPVELLASFGGSDQALAQPTETSTSGLPTGLVSLPVAGYDYGGNWASSTGGISARWNGS